jgi:hypothetical protein
MNSAIIRSARITRRAVVAGAGVLSVSIANADDAPRQAAPVDARQATGSESWISGLAVQAATYAVPIVAMYNLRDSTSVGPRAKVPPNEIWRIENIASPTIAEQAGYVTPNVNVIYGFGFMDLSQQPIILSAPDSQGRYYWSKFATCGPMRSLTSAALAPVTRAARLRWWDPAGKGNCRPE